MSARPNGTPFFELDPVAVLEWLPCHGIYEPPFLSCPPVRYVHKDGGLWPDLLSVFRKQLKADNGFSFKGLVKLECSKTHKLDTLLHNQFQVAVANDDGMLDVTVFLLQHPKWIKKAYLEGYQLSIVAVYPDFQEDTVSKVMAKTPLILFKDPLEPLHFQLPMPSPTAPWILFMGVNGCRKDEYYDLP